MAKEKLAFTQIEIDTLSAEQNDAFMAYLQAKSAFRVALQDDAPDGHRIVFTEKYGTIEHPEQSVLKVALVKAGSAKPKGERKSLAEYLAERQANGLRS